MFQVHVVYQKFPLMSSYLDTKYSSHIFSFMKWNNPEPWPISSLCFMTLCLVPESNFQIFLSCKSYNVVLTEITLLVAVRFIQMRIAWCIQYKPDNFCKMALVDSESRPLNFVFLLWIIEFTKKWLHLWKTTTT